MSKSKSGCHVIYLLLTLNTSCAFGERNMTVSQHHPSGCYSVSQSISMSLLKEKNGRKM